MVRISDHSRSYTQCGAFQFTAFWIRPPHIPWSGWFKRVWVGGRCSHGKRLSPWGSLIKAWSVFGKVFQWPYYGLLFPVNAMEPRLEGWNRDEGHVGYICFRLENLIAYRAD